MARILIIDDDNDVCNLLQKQFTRDGHEALFATSGRKAMLLIQEKEFDLVFCDYRLSDTNGKELLLSIKKYNSSIQVIIITGYSDIRIAVEVIKCGAFDFVTKPILIEELRLVTEKALALRKGHYISAEKNILPLSSQSSAFTYSEKMMEGESEQASEVRAQVELIASTNYSVIIYGESGTGKESIAYKIHKQSSRGDKPFIAVDCGALTKELSGSELFGHEKGSFTGALQTKIGQFELAQGGTIFLDEITNLDYEIQISLLRVIQERKIRRIGSQKEIDIDVRVIVASNEKLKEAMLRGRFREDLYHRFNEFEIELQPLRNRKEDILHYANFFIKKTNQELGKYIKNLSAEAEQVFRNYQWPGNLREMNNVIKRACLMSPGEEITLDALPSELTARSNNVNTLERNLIKYEEKRRADISSGTDLKTISLKAEYDRILQVLSSVSFNKTKAALMLNIDRKTLYNKIHFFNKFFKSDVTDSASRFIAAREKWR